MEILITAEYPKVIKLGSSLGITIPLFLFKQVIKSPTYNIFLENNCIILGDLSYFSEYREGGEFRKSFNKNGSCCNKIPMTNFLESINVGEFDSVEMYSDFQTYIKLKKCDTIK